MRNNVFGAIALAAAVLASAPAFAGDHGPDFQERQKLQNEQGTFSYGYGDSASGYSRPASFTVIRLSEVGDGEAAAVNAKATPANVEALQASLDEATRAELIAHGLQIKNIIGSTTAFNGRTVYYVQ